MIDMDRNPLPLLLLVCFVSVGVGALGTRLMLTERPQSPIRGLYERVDAIILILWLVVGLILLLGGFAYASSK